MIIFEFEQAVFELEAKIDELRHMTDGGMNLAQEVSRLEQKRKTLLTNIYERLTPWQKVQVARHPNRPQGLDYIQYLITEYTPLAGDRLFGEDHALIGGLGRFYGKAVCVLAIHRGHDTEERLFHNFGMAQPEGYRKAQRLMDLAHKFDLPLITFVDTAGAYPGIGAEERGQAEAIARCIEKAFSLSVPTLAVITGEGGSGGAVALSVVDKVFMLEHSIYSVISPEGCASILWRSAEKAAEAAAALHLTAQDLLALKVIDGIIPEPLGGAHRDAKATTHAVAQVLQEALQELEQKPRDRLTTAREEKFLSTGC
ncbi:MAG: acetyl-CoA carboxylase carboxyltransferase subunit alpha [Holosporales bacterium]|jgi:acetyl-CoA carboxylase carboxyl transferase subunit alpha|nr:acetyl-CoA carboxylase carboxyltransferase subunit alpha [Holosporales bacterium]